MASTEQAVSPVVPILVTDASVSGICPGCGHIHRAEDIVRQTKSPTDGGIGGCATPVKVTEQLRLLYEGLDAKHSVTDTDAALASDKQASLLYGEFHPDGLSKLLDKEHCHADDAVVLCDLGMGGGRALVQALLQYPNLLQIVGVELAQQRFDVAVDAMDRLKLCTGFFEDSTATNVDNNPSLSQVKRWIDPVAGRSLELWRQSMFDVEGSNSYASLLNQADVILCDVELPGSQRLAFFDFLTRHTKVGARVATYRSFEALLENHDDSSPHGTSGDKGVSEPLIHTKKDQLIRMTEWKQLETNRSTSDRFYTSWAPQRGYHFFIYERQASHL